MFWWKKVVRHINLLRREFSKEALTQPSTTTSYIIVAICAEQKETLGVFVIITRSEVSSPPLIPLNSELDSSRSSAEKWGHVASHQNQSRQACMKITFPSIKFKSPALGASVLLPVGLFPVGLYQKPMTSIGYRCTSFVPVSVWATVHHASTEFLEL